MIKINKSSDGLFYVTYHGGNNQVLVISETLKSKQSAIKNIRAVAGIFCGNDTDIEVSDCTGKEIKVIIVTV